MQNIAVTRDLIKYLSIPSVAKITQVGKIYNPEKEYEWKMKKGGGEEAEEKRRVGWKITQIFVLYQAYSTEVTMMEVCL